MYKASDLTIGTVFELFYDTQSKPPKSKISIIVGMTNDKSEFATVFINTTVNMHLLNIPELQALQLEISPGASYPFLKHNSFIDCSQIYTRFPDSCIREINAGSGRILSQLPSAHIQKVIELIKSNESLSRHKTQLYNLT
jgi:hypothetical protein